MSRDSKSADNLLIFRLTSGPYRTGLNCAQFRQLMLPQIMQLIQIDVIRAQNSQTPLKVVFLSRVTPVRFLPISSHARPGEPVTKLNARLPWLRGG